jgi:hypothetical protein
MGSLGLHTDLSVSDTLAVFKYYASLGFFPDTSADGPGTDPIGGRPAVSVNGSIPFGTVPIDFGTVPVDGPGGATSVRNVQISNTGTSDLVLRDWHLTGPFTPSRSLSDGIVVSAGSTASFDLTYDPTVVGAVNGQLSFTTNDPFNSSVKIQLTGVGQDLQADLQVDRAAASFGGTALGATGSTQTFVIRNAGLQDLHISSLTIGHGATAYSIASPSTVPTVLTPGQSASIQVLFRADSVGLIPGQLIIASNDPDTPLMTLHLIGTGLNPAAPPARFRALTSGSRPRAASSSTTG